MSTTMDEPQARPTDAAARAASLDPEGSPEQADRLLGRWPLWAGLGLLLVPLLVSAWVQMVRVGSSFHAVSDNGLNELHTRDVGRHLVTLGPYSRDGWNHPGPAMYYLLAIPYRLTGSHSVGMLVGALVINAVAVAGIVVVAWRRGRLPMFAGTVLGLAVVMHSLGPDFLGDPWNPYVTVLPFTLLLMLVWELSTGRCWALPASAGLATFLVQTHIGYLPLALPLLLGGTLWFLVVARRHGDPGVIGAPALDRSRLARAGIVTAVVLVVMWLPPIIGVIQHTPGNLAKATQYFLHAKSDHRLLEGYRLVAQQFSSRPEWLTGAHTPNAFSGEPDFINRAPVPWLAIPFVVSLWLFWRRRHPEAVTFAVIVVLATGLGVFALSRIIGPMYTYRLRWTWVLGMLAMALVVWALWVGGSRLSSPSLRRLLVVPLAAAMAVLTVVNTVNASHASTPEAPESTNLAKLVPQLLKALPNRAGVVIVAPTSFGSSVYASGIVLWLERLGIPVRVPDVLDAAAGWDKRRLYHGEPVRAYVTIGDDVQYDSLAANPRQRLVAYTGKLSPKQRVVVAEQLAMFRAQRLAGTIDDQELFLRSRALVDRFGIPIGLFLRKP